MKVLFVHQNYPGQYKHLAPALVARGVQAIALTDESNLERARHLAKGVPVVGYATPKGASPSTHGYLQSAESHVRRGQAAARAAIKLQQNGFAPDVIVAHPAWGESLFLKDVFPAAKLLLYAEFFYRSAGSDFNFDPEYPASFDQRCKLRLRNTTQLVSFESADAALSPTFWQRQQYPEAIRDRISVVHDGIDTAQVRRRDDARFALSTGEVLTAQDEVLTYVSRNLEPYRGFHSLMRALPRIQAERPSVKTIIVGGDDVSYGRRPPKGQTYRELMLAEMQGKIDLDRIFFVGRIPYDRYLDLLSVSTAHIYLTYPFVLSWSMLEAMACNCRVIASRTPPVEEIIEDGKNGYLVDFFSPVSIAEKAVAVLQNRRGTGAIGASARQTILDRYDLARCLPLQMELLESVGYRTGK